MLTTNVTYGYVYPLCVNGKLIAEIEGQCVLIVGGIEDGHLSVEDVHDITFYGLDASAPLGTAESTYVAASTPEEFVLEALIKTWLTSGVDDEDQLDAAYDGWRENAA